MNPYSILSLTVSWLAVTLLVRWVLNERKPTPVAARYEQRVASAEPTRVRENVRVDFQTACVFRPAIKAGSSPNSRFPS